MQLCAGDEGQDKQKACNAPDQGYAHALIMGSRFRARKPSVSLDALGDLAGPTIDVHDRTDARDGLRRLYAVLGRMTPDARTAFALYAIDGRSIAEVAAVIGTTVVTAKLRIWRARREVARRAAADPVLGGFLAQQETR